MEVEVLPGYVKNVGKDAHFRLQKSIVPGTKVALEHTYLVVGKKSGLDRGLEFVGWLRDNHFPGPDWKFYDAQDEELKLPTLEVEETPVPVEVPTPEAGPETKAKGAGRTLRRKSTRVNKNEITPADIVEAAPEKAKALIETCKDKAVLKKAMALTNHFAQKEEHRRYLMRRLEQVY